MIIDGAFEGEGHIHMLEDYLQSIRDKNRHSLVGIVAVTWAVPGREAAASVGWAGASDLEQYGIKAAEKLLSTIRQKVASYALPPTDMALNASYVVWNVAYGPTGFDFVTWLINAEMTRRREGALGPLKVGFYLGTDPEVALQKKNNGTWMERVYRPAMAMLGAVEDDRAIYGRTLEAFLPAPIVRAYLHGEGVPMFKSTVPSPRPGCVTITLREAAHWPHRNSKMEEWLRFAGYLKSQGEDVVFVRDTARAYEPIPHFDTHPPASLDLVQRLALYEGAKCNFSVGGGPWQLCLYGTSPWLSFLQVESELDLKGYRPNTPDYWRHYMGIEPGAQFPWSGKNQRIIWAPAVYDHIVQAWENFNVA